MAPDQTDDTQSPPTDPPQSEAAEDEPTARRESFDQWFARQYPDLAPDPQPVAPNVPPPALQPRQLTAARLLLAGRRVKDVAARLGVHRHTVSAWLKDPAFQREVSRLATVLPLPELCAEDTEEKTP